MKQYIQNNKIRVCIILVIHLSGFSITAQTNSLNYIKSVSYLDSSSTRKVTSVSYFGAFGQPLQDIVIGVSPGGKDIVQPYQYDSLGRISKSYLPFTATGENGEFMTDAINLQSSFYQNLNIEGGNIPYSEAEYEYSPYGRVVKQSVPGQDINSLYSSSDFVPAGGITRWKVDDQNQLIKEPVVYAANSLIKITVKDMDGKTIDVYKDKSGRVLQKTENNGLHTTRYVYDKYGLLRYVMSPEGESKMTESLYTPTSSLVKQYCYYYEYNAKHQLVTKQLPGKAAVYLRYDGKYRLRLTQDGNQRLTGKWMFVNYDQLGRVVSTGLGVWNGEDPNIPDEIVPPSENGISPFFTYQYYDTYDSITDPNLQFDTASAFHEKSGRIRGRETGSKVKYIDGGIEKWLTSVVYYDKYGRAVQSISKNNVGGYDIVNNRYNFAGELLESKQKHTDYNNQTKYLVYLYRYDETGRLLNLSLSQNENGSDAVMIDSLTYHETGQVKEKRMHSENGTGFLQTVDYSYNIRGALTYMNNPDNLNGDLFAMRLFYDKNSEGGFNTYKDGKISSMEWNSMKLDGKQTYTYTYDDANRLTGATFTPSGRYDMTFAYDKNGNITNLTRNGQIITNAVKDGVKTEIISYGTIDNLSYGYTGNQLLTVSDLIGSVTTQLNNDFRDNGINLRTEYEYDANGNMTKDLNKGISLVTYNHLNQPVEVVMSKGKTIYTYAATGLKLKTEEYTDGSLSKTTEYSGAFVYENAQLSYINIPDGRYVVSTGKYEYNLTDHLGNVHVTFTKSATGTAELISEDHYYPFGLQMSGQHFENTTFLNKYLYNGKEKQTQTGYFDYGFRQLDPQLCRWHVADAMAESYLSISPYAYVENNPISFMDYMGLTKMSMEDAIAYLFSDKCEFGGTWTNSGGGGGDVKEHTAADVRNMNHTRDDYFTRNGEYLGYSAVGSSSIRILNTADSAIPDGFYINETMKTIDPFIGLLNSWSLSEARQLGEVDDNSLMKIFNYYKDLLNIKYKLNPQKISKGELRKATMIADVENRSIIVNILRWDQVKYYDNFNNIISDFLHENAHIKDYIKDPLDYSERCEKVKGFYNKYIESPAFLAQMKDPSYKYVSEDYHRTSTLYMINCGILMFRYNFRDGHDVYYKYHIFINDQSFMFNYYSID